MRILGAAILAVLTVTSARADNYTMAFFANGKFNGYSVGLTDNSGSYCHDGSSLRTIDLCPLPQRFYVCESSYGKIMSQLGNGNSYQIRNTSVSGNPQVC